MLTGQKTDKADPAIVLIVAKDGPGDHTCRGRKGDEDECARPLRMKRLVRVYLDTKRIKL